MKILDKRIELTKKYQAELDHRNDVEKEAIKLIENGQYLEAVELLDTLDDSIIRTLQEELDNLEQVDNEETVNNIKEEVCDSLCKYKESCTPEEWERLEICEECPLNKF